MSQCVWKNNIVDPTSLYKHADGRWYFVTAESEKPWFCEQEYVTNVYWLNSEG